MDTQSKDILEQLLERLDKMDSQQHKLDRVMERLDTLQNVLEKQNKKQNQLDDKLVELIIKLEHERIVTAEQQQAAHQETMQPRHVIDSHGESTLFQHKITQQQEGWSSRIAEKLKSIDDRTADTARKYDQLTSWSRKTEDKLKELADNNKDFIKTFLVEIRSVKDLIKGQTNSELIWLNNQIDKKLSDIGPLVKAIYQQQREAREEIVRSRGQMVRTALQHDTQQGHTESMNNQQKLSTGISDKHMRAILDLERSTLDRIQVNTATVLKEIDNTKACMISGHTAMNNNFEKLTTDLKDYTYKTKREIFAVTEKEAQIVRDRIKGPLISHGKYTFDFFVNNFKTLVSSGKSADSIPWHINEMQTCVTGSVDMRTNGEMKVWLFFGRHPREVGLQPKPGKTLKIKATISDINEKKLPSLDVGEITGFLSEANIKVNGDMGFQVGETSCDMLLEKGYGDKEKYANGAILIRFEITV